MKTKPSASDVQRIREALKAFLAEAEKVDPSRLADRAPAYYGLLIGIAKTLADIRLMGKRAHGRMTYGRRGHADLPPEFRKFNETLRRFRDRTEGRRERVEHFKSAVSILRKLIVSDLGDGTVIVRNGSEEVRFHIPGNYSYERVGCGVEKDDGRAALLVKIKKSLGKCEKVLSDAAVEVNARKIFADRKGAAFKGMLELMKEVKSHFAPDIIKYAAFEDADLYDETIISAGVRKLGEGIFAPRSPEMKSLDELLTTFKTETGYPTDLSKTDLIEGIPPSLHDLVEWFMPNERDRVVTVADIREVVEAGTNKACKHMTVVGNRIARRQRAGSAGVNPKRSNRENALLQKVRDIVAKNVKAGRKPNVSAACDFVQRNTKNSPFETKEQLRNRYNTDRDKGYLAI